MLRKKQKDMTVGFLMEMLDEVAQHRAARMPTDNVFAKELTWTEIQALVQYKKAIELAVAAVTDWLDSTE